MSEYPNVSPPTPNLVDLWILTTAMPALKGTATTRGEGGKSRRRRRATRQQAGDEAEKETRSAGNDYERKNVAIA
jgi:hypothetical protein